MSIAKHIIEKCGGVAEVAKIVGQSESWVHRWTYDKERGGTGGTIPRRAQEKLLEAAQSGLVDVTPADFFAATSGAAK